MAIIIGVNPKPFGSYKLKYDLDYYLDIATKILHTRSINKYLHHKYINDDTVSALAYFLMVGETRYDETRNIPIGVWRTINAVDGMKTIRNSILRKKKYESDSSIDVNIGFKDKTSEINDFWGDIKAILKDERQYNVVHDYYVGRKTMLEISKDIGICRERVRQILDNATERLTEYAKQ